MEVFKGLNRVPNATVATNHPRLTLIVVAAGSIAAPFSPGFGWLIGFRILQGIGSSAIYPAGMALVRHHITDRHAQALAVLSVFSSASAGFGPAIGGLLIHFWNWPAIFVVNIPIIAGAFVLALWVLPADARSAAGRPGMASGPDGGGCPRHRPVRRCCPGDLAGFAVGACPKEHHRRAGRIGGFGVLHLAGIFRDPTVYPATHLRPEFGDDAGRPPIYRSEHPFLCGFSRHSDVFADGASCGGRRHPASLCCLWRCALSWSRRWPVGGSIDPEFAQP